MSPVNVEAYPRASIIRFPEEGSPPELSPAAKRALDWAWECAERRCDKDTGDFIHELQNQPYAHGTMRCALNYLLRGGPGDAERAKALLRREEVMACPPSVCVHLLMLKKMGRVLDEETKALLLSAIAELDTEDGEDIIGGRNTNIPLMNWTIRIAQGVLFDKPELVEAGAAALEKLVDLVTAHGTIPEFNSPAYHPVTLSYLHVIQLLGEPRTAGLAEKLSRHLWQEMAWRYHPRLLSFTGPWGRAYLDNFVGGSGLAPLMLHLVWDALYCPEVAYPCEMSHCHLHAGVFALMLLDTPADFDGIALEKSYPLTVISSAEQACVELGDDEHLSYVPGDIAELTTWLDENLAVGTASRSHLHGLQNATYLAQWTRTGKRVEKLKDLGQAFTHFIINNKRPGDSEHVYRNHHRGATMRIGPCLWGDDGRPFALQSGPTALVAYVPKGQERWAVRSLEMFAVLPRLDTIDGIFVDGAAYNGQRTNPSDSVVIRSGNVALGMRFDACDPALTNPELIIEEANDWLLVGLRLASWREERDLPERTHRRYGGSMGLELRYAPGEDALAAFVQEMKASSLNDCWEMAVQGGPRELAFRVGGKELYGRFDPIGECWLRRRLPPAPRRTEADRL